jgi:hypothetical protein
LSSTSAAPRCADTGCPAVAHEVNESCREPRQELTTIRYCGALRGAAMPLLRCEAAAYREPHQLEIQPVRVRDATLCKSPDGTIRRPWSRCVAAQALNLQRLHAECSRTARDRRRLSDGCFSPGFIDVLARRPLAEPALLFPPISQSTPGTLYRHSCRAASSDSLAGAFLCARAYRSCRSRDDQTPAP